MGMNIHKKPEGGGLSAVGGNSTYTYYGPDAPEYAGLVGNLKKSIGNLKNVLDITDEPLPLLWTADFIPMDGATPGSTEYVVGEFNCSCVGIFKFQAQCGGSIEAVDDEGYFDACKLTDLMGQKAVEISTRPGVTKRAMGAPRSRANSRRGAPAPALR